MNRHHVAVCVPGLEKTRLVIHCDGVCRVGMKEATMYLGWPLGKNHGPVVLAIS